MQPFKTKDIVKIFVFANINDVEKTIASILLVYYAIPSLNLLDTG